VTALERGEVGNESREETAETDGQWRRAMGNEEKSEEDVGSSRS
jgi:hypothetical protein